MYVCRFTDTGPESRRRDKQTVWLFREFADKEGKIGDGCVSFFEPCASYWAGLGEERELAQSIAKHGLPPERDLVDFVPMESLKLVGAPVEHVVPTEG